MERQCGENKVLKCTLELSRVTNRAPSASPFESRFYANVFEPYELVVWIFKPANYKARGWLVYRRLERYITNKQYKSVSALTHIGPNIARRHKTCHQTFAKISIFYFRRTVWSLLTSTTRHFSIGYVILLGNFSIASMRILMVYYRRATTFYKHHTSWTLFMGARNYLCHCISNESNSGGDNNSLTRIGSLFHCSHLLINTQLHFTRMLVYGCGKYLPTSWIFVRHQRPLSLIVWGPPCDYSGPDSSG